MRNTKLVLLMRSGLEVAHNDQAIAFIYAVSRKRYYAIDSVRAIDPREPPVIEIETMQGLLCFINAIEIFD